MSDCSLLWHVFEYPPKRHTYVLFDYYMAGACFVYTIQPCTSLLCYFIQSYINKMHVCLAVTCRLHFSQNDQDIVCATAVTQGWNGH